MLLPGLLALSASLAAPSPAAQPAATPVLAAQDPVRIARSGPAAELDLARHLVRAARPEQALAHLDGQLAGTEDPTADPGTAALARERARVAGFLELRDAFFAGLAADTGRLRIPVGEKHRNLKVAAYADGVITFEKNKYDVESITVAELAIADLAKAWKAGKVEPLEQQAYALALAGDRGWSKVWGRDAEGPAELLADLEDAVGSAERGAKVEALRELEAFLGERLSAKDGRRVVELVEGVWPEGGVALEDDPGKHRFRVLRDLVTAGLEASFGPKDLPAVMHAAEAEMRGEELWLRYDFAKEEQLGDWLRDETHLPEVRMKGVLQTPEDDWRIGIVDGGLELLGVQGLRFALPYKGPLRLRYGMQIPEVGEEGLLWQMRFHLHDDLEKNRFVVLNFGYTIELLELDYPSEVEREEQYYEIGRDYFVELVTDRKNDLVVRREDLTEDFDLAMPSRRVNRGYVRLASLTDYPTRITSFELTGTPDMAQLDLYQGAFVDLRLEQLGF